MTDASPLSFPDALPDQLRIDELLAQASVLEAQDGAQALDLLQQAHALAAQIQDPTRAGRGLLQCATLEWRRSAYGAARQHAAEALALFRQTGDRAQEAWALRLLGNIHGVQSEYGPASEFLQAAATLSRATGNAACLASCLNNLGIIANDLGDYAAALEHLFGALQTYAPGDQHIPSTLNNIASLHRKLGQHERALEVQQQTLALAGDRDGEAHPLMATFQHNLAETLQKLGRHAEALPLLDTALQRTQATGDRLTAMMVYDSLGQSHHALGHDEQARQQYDLGLALAAEVKQPLAEVRLRMHCAALQPSGQLEALEQALTLAEATGLKAEQLEVHDLLVTLHREAGAFGPALQHSERARQLERELFNAAQDRRAQALQIQYELDRTRELAQAQQALNEQLKQANEELDAFSYSISHDLRAPVRHIAGFATLLRRALGPDASPTALRHLGVIEGAAERLNTLIDVLLSFARQARQPLQRRAVDLGQLVGELRAELAPDTQGRVVRWEVGALPEVQADPTLLRQVLMNLLSNALKYSQPRAEAVITVWAELGEHGWVISVQDNGVGFDPKYRERLFGVFQRLHPASEFEGVGIGLANVQRIVQRHGGQVWAESQLGQGATFRFSLPA